MGKIIEDFKKSNLAEEPGSGVWGPFLPKIFNYNILQIILFSDSILREPLLRSPSHDQDFIIQHLLLHIYVILLHNVMKLIFFKKQDASYFNLILWICENKKHM